MARLFGTDGVRGIAGSELTEEIAAALGSAAVQFLGPRIVIGRDTRASGKMLEGAMVAGIAAAGGHALLAGIIPTPGVALLIPHMGADGGAVISASHNPPEYNGIKLFDSAGFKLGDSLEDQIEAWISNHDGVGSDASAAMNFSSGPNSANHIEPIQDAAEFYINHAVNSVLAQGFDFSGWTIAVDTAHGAASITTPEALRRLGARVIAINDTWDGHDINVCCGSTHLVCLRDFMRETGADVGIAHDGDADRALLLTPTGREIDGDAIEALLAVDMKERGQLPHDTVVSTVMCNLGFVLTMRRQGIDVVQTAVGDRYVLEEMRRGGFAIGGEQSGHLILLDYNSTGDGLMSAVQFLAAAKRRGITVEQAADFCEKLPQVVRSVAVPAERDKRGVAESAPVAACVRAAAEALGQAGRVLVRPSGTEPVIRVMVEAEDESVAKAHVQSIAQAISQACE